MEKVNDPREFYNLSEEKQRILMYWVEQMEPIKTYNETWNSYRLKHLFEKSKDGFYVTNGEFKGAMLASSFEVKDKIAINWVFNVSKRSINKLIELQELK